MFFRDAKIVGITKGNLGYGHTEGCVCESCGPLYLLALSEYEIKRLQEALERRDGRDSGDWHGQIRFKLQEAVGPWNPPEEVSK